MRKLLKTSLQNILNKQNIKNNTINQFLQQNNIQKYDNAIVRLPERQVKALLKMPCAVSQNNLELTSIFKRLRKSYQIQQKTACCKCDLKCNFRDIPAQFRSKTIVKDIMHLLFLLLQQPQHRYSILRWSSAFKVAQSLRILFQTPINNSIEQILYHELIKSQESKIKMKKPSRKSIKQTKQQLRKQKIAQQLKNRRVKL